MRCKRISDNLTGVSGTISLCKFRRRQNNCHVVKVYCTLFTEHKLCVCERRRVGWRYIVCEPLPMSIDSIVWNGWRFSIPADSSAHRHSKCPLASHSTGYIFCMNSTTEIMVANMSPHPSKRIQLYDTLNKLWLEISAKNKKRISNPTRLLYSDSKRSFSVLCRSMLWIFGSNEFHFAYYVHIRFDVRTYVHTNIFESVIDDRNSSSHTSICDDRRSNRCHSLRSARRAFILLDSFMRICSSQTETQTAHTHTLSGVCVCATVLYQMADDKRKTIIYFHIFYYINLWRVDWHEYDTCTHSLCDSMYPPDRGHPTATTQAVSQSSTQMRERNVRKKGWKARRRWTNTKKYAKKWRICPYFSILFMYVFLRFCHSS